MTVLPETPAPHINQLPIAIETECVNGAISTRLQSTSQCTSQGIWTMTNANLSSCSCQRGHIRYRHECVKQGMLDN